ncbi:hypothetical protein VTI74DRAFT_9674 [Chaetomium olivicolor]
MEDVIPHSAHRPPHPRHHRQPQDLSPIAASPSVAPALLSWPSSSLPASPPPPGSVPPPSPSRTLPATSGTSPG